MNQRPSTVSSKAMSAWKGEDMRALCIGLAAAALAARLLGTLVVCRRSHGFSLECPVHTLMRPVLLRSPWRNPLVTEAECDPPHGEPTQAETGPLGRASTALLGGERAAEQLRKNGRWRRRPPPACLGKIGAASRRRARDSSRGRSELRGALVSRVSPLGSP